LNNYHYLSFPPDGDYSVLANWAIRDPGLTATEVGKRLGLSKSAFSRAATRGQKLIVNQSLSPNTKLYDLKIYLTYSIFSYMASKKVGF